MPFGFHGLDLVVILVIALLIFGPKKLPEMGASIGKSIKEFKKGMSEISGHHDDDDDEDEEPKLPKGKDLDKLSTKTTQSEVTIKPSASEAGSTEVHKETEVRTEEAHVE